MLKIIINGDPVPQARIRIFRRGNKIMTFDPQAAIKKEMRDIVRDQFEGWEKFKYPRVLFWFNMPIPKSMPKAERFKAREGLLKHVKKPDVDNLVKLYLDVISGIVMEDDNCASLGSAIKVYSDKPKTVIFVQETADIVSLDEIYEGTWPIAS